MKKKIFKIFSICIISCIGIMGLIACDTEEKFEHKHNFTSVVIAPTCTESGYTTHTCSCGENYNDTYVSALNHEFTNYVFDNNATQEADGTKTAICNRIGCDETDTIIDVGSKLPTQEHTHSYTDSISAPTCTEQGYTTHTCSCGASYIDTYISALDHEFTNYISDNNATQEADGTKTAICNRIGCDETDTIIDVGSKLPTQEHTHSYTDSISAPTCTEQGYTTHTCSCGTNYIDTYTPAIGHNFVSDACSKCKIYIGDVAVEIYDLSANLDETIKGYVLIENNATSLYILGAGEMKNYEFSNTPIYNDGYYQNLEYLYIDEGISSIGDYLLYNCQKIEKIELPTTIKKIGNNAFNWCRNIENLTIPQGVISIGNYAFYNLDILSITIPNSVTNIGSYSFANCVNLTNINIDSNSSMYSIGAKAFYNTSYYKNADNWNNKLLYLHSFLLESKTTISGELDVKDGTKVIADNAFYDCSSLTKVIVPDTVVGIGKSSFGGCNGLKYIKLPFSGATIDGNIDSNFGYIFGAYSGYSNKNYVPTSLMEIVITGGQKIDNHAFYGCDFITTLTLPYVGTSLNSNEFFGAVFGATNTSNYVVPSSLSTVTILSGKITAHAFHGCDGLENVILRNGVTEIGEGAFYNCSSIKTLTLPFIGQNATATSGYNAVFGYIFGYGIKTYSFGYTGTGGGAYWSTSDYDLSINQYSYSQSGTQYMYYYKIPTSLKTVIITETNNIPQHAFYKCSMLQTIIVPLNVNIETNAFEECNAEIICSCNEGEHNIVEIERVEATCQSVGHTEGTKCNICGIIFSGNKEIEILSHEFVDGICNSCGKKEFSRGLLYTLDESSDTYIVSGIGTCTDLDIIIPKTHNGILVTSISDDAFYNRTSLTSIILPDSVTSIGHYAFCECTSLTSVTIGNGVISIGESAFRGCDSLTNIVIPDSVVSIGYGAFYGCSNLTSVTFKNTNGWYVSTSYTATSGTNVDVTNSVTNVTYLKITYDDYYWKRK